MPAGRIAAVTTTAAHQKRWLLLSLLTLLTLAGAFLAPAVDASASTRVGVETRVRAIDTPTTALVAAHDRSSSTPVGGIPPAREITSVSRRVARAAPLHRRALPFLGFIMDPLDSAVTTNVRAGWKYPGLTDGWGVG